MLCQSRNTCRRDEPELMRGGRHSVAPGLQICDISCHELSRDNLWNRVYID